MLAALLTKGACRIEECAAPVPAQGQVLIKVAYGGINRADLLQLQGRYPLPQNTPPIGGMELSGEIIACAPDVKHFTPGDRVCALVSEGAFAQLCTADAALLCCPCPPM